MPYGSLDESGRPNLQEQELLSGGTPFIGSYCPRRGQEQLGPRPCFSHCTSTRQPLLKNGSGSDRGQGLAEYIIITLLIAIIVIVGIRYFGSSVQNQFTNATDELAHMDKRDAPATGGNFEATSRSGGGGDQLGSSSSGHGGGSGGAGGGDSLKTRGVGDDDSTVISAIEIDWRTLIIIGIFVVAGGVAVVMRMTKDKKKDKQKKKKSKRKFSLFGKKKGGEGGQAMAEFVLIAITFFFVILGLMQMAMIFNAYTLTRYAAYNAARAAIVHGADEEKMREAARLSLLAVFPRHGRADHLKGFVENYLGAKATDSDPSFHTYTFTAGGNSHTFSDPITEVRVVPGRGRNSGEVVTFDDTRDAEKGVITVEVTHRYEMVVPLVNRILFYVYNLYRMKQLGEGPGYQGETLDNLSATTNKLRRGNDDYAKVEYRFPLIAHYTMRLQSDYVVP